MMKVTSRITGILYAVESMSLEFVPTSIHTNVKKE